MNHAAKMNQMSVNSCFATLCVYMHIIIMVTLYTNLTNIRKLAFTVCAKNDDIIIKQKNHGLRKSDEEW